MPCVHVTLPTLPALPGFSIAPPPLPPIDLSVNFCCKLFSFTIHPVISLGVATIAIPGLNAAFMAINAQIELVQAYLDALPPKCPRQD